MHSFRTIININILYNTHAYIECDDLLNSYQKGLRLCLQNCSLLSMSIV